MILPGPRLLTLLLLWATLFPAGAIGIRHDVDEQAYEDLSQNRLPYTAGAEYPDFAAVCAVGVPNRKKPFEILGSGTLIAPDWVLTAAHVVLHPLPPRDFEKDLRVRFGADSRDGFLEREVAEVILPLPVPKMRALQGPGWRYLEKQIVRAEYHDLALLRLRRPMNDITPIRWASAVDDLTGTTVWLSGYGDWATGDNTKSKTWTPAGLRRAAQNLIDRDRTTDPWDRQGGGIILFDFDNGEEERNTLNIPSRDWESLFGSGNSDATPLPLEGAAYPGDSGGPAIARLGEEWQVVGVSGYGTGYPPDKRKSGIEYGDILVFCRVPSHAEWIESVIGDVDSDVYVMDPPPLDPSPTRSVRQTAEEESSEPPEPASIFLRDP